MSRSATAVLVAFSAGARSMPGWRQVFDDIGRIFETVWRWHREPRY